MDHDHKAEQLQQDSLVRESSTNRNRNTEGFLEYSMTSPSTCLAVGVGAKLYISVVSLQLVFQFFFTEVSHNVVARTIASRAACPRKIITHSLIEHRELKKSNSNTTGSSSIST